MTVRVRMESQPAGVALGTVTVCVPACVNVTPWKVNGSSLSQTVAVCVPLRTGFTVTVRVSIESHPAGVALGTVTVCVPACVKVTPWNVNGSSLSQMVAVCVPY